MSSEISRYLACGFDDFIRDWVDYEYSIQISTIKVFRKISHLKAIIISGIALYRIESKAPTIIKKFLSNESEKDKNHQIDFQHLTGSKSSHTKLFLLVGTGVCCSAILIRVQFHSQFPKKSIKSHQKCPLID